MKNNSSKQKQSSSEDESEPEYEVPVKKLKIMSKNNPIQPKKNSNNFAQLTKSNSVPLSSLTSSKTAKSTQDQSNSDLSTDIIEIFNESIETRDITIQEQQKEISKLKTKAENQVVINYLLFNTLNLPLIY
jgi:hypothetical protein